jgi:hypothetical protein
MVPPLPETDIIVYAAPAATASPAPVRGRGERVLRGAILSGVVLLDVALAAWAFMSIRLAFILLHMHG